MEVLGGNCRHGVQGERAEGFLGAEVLWVAGGGRNRGAEEMTAGVSREGSRGRPERDLKARTWMLMLEPPSTHHYLCVHLYIGQSLKDSPVQVHIMQKELIGIRARSLKVARPHFACGQQPKQAEQPDTVLPTRER